MRIYLVTFYEGYGNYGIDSEFTKIFLFKRNAQKFVDSDKYGELELIEWEIEDDLIGGVKNVLRRLFNRN